MSSSTTAFDLPTFKQAIERRDAGTQLGMYADDAQVTLADRINQPGSPRVLRGKAEIASWIEDICGRDMTHRVQAMVSDQDGAAFAQACRYPDGTIVLCATILELEQGLITRQVGVQAWDE